MFDIADNGSAFRMKNRWSFMASRDAWAAPVQVKVGPDGAIWVSDFYTLVAQHNPTPDTAVYRATSKTERCCRNGPGNAYETPNRDRLHGRIYRISYDSARATTTRLDNATPAQLVAALRNDNLFWRLTAQRLLVDRGNLDIIRDLLRLTTDHTVDELGLNPGALHALWTLHGLGAIPGNPEAVAAARKALHHPAASVRRAAIQVLPRDAELVTGMFAAGIVPDRASPWPVDYTVASSLLQDADAHVRLEAVLAMSELPANPKVATVAAEMLFVPDNMRDPWMPDAIAIVGAKQDIGFLNGILQRRAPTDTASIAGLTRAVNLVASGRAAATDAGLVLTVTNAAQLNPAVARGLLQGIAIGWPDEKAPALTEDQRAALRAVAKTIMDANPAPAPGAGGRGGAGGGGAAQQGGPNQPFAAIFAQLGTKWGSPTLFTQQ
jgi:hypothetical protein